MRVKDFFAEPANTAAELQRNHCTFPQMSFGDFRHGADRPGRSPPPVNRFASILTLLVMAAILAGIGWMMAPMVIGIWDHLIE